MHLNLRITYKKTLSKNHLIMRLHIASVTNTTTRFFWLEGMSLASGFFCCFRVLQGDWGHRGKQTGI
jgi:hypothetical protein